MRDLTAVALNTAKRHGATYGDIRIIQSTGQALMVRNGELGEMQQVESIGYGIRVLVNGSWGFAASPRTRDATFLIEHGKIRGPVKNMRFTESILDCFNRIEAVGLETDYVNSFWGSGIVAPSLKIRDFNFSSKTTF